MPRVRFGAKSKTTSKGRKDEQPSYPKVVPQLTLDNTGVIFDRVCWIRCTPRSATYMINGKAYVIPHSQVHDDSESYYVAADFEMSTRCKQPCKLVAKTWIVAQKQDEQPELRELLEESGIYLNEYGKLEDPDDPADDWGPEPIHWWDDPF